MDSQGPYHHQRALSVVLSGLWHRDHCPSDGIVALHPALFLAYSPAAGNPERQREVPVTTMQT